MAGKRKLLATVAFAVMGAVGWWLTSGDAPSAPPPAAPAVSEQAAPAPKAPAETTSAPVQAAPQAGELLFRRYEADTSRALPEVCLVFSAALNEKTPEAYSAFLRSEDAKLPPPRVDGKKLCLGGFSYGKSYRVTLRAGLPGEGETRLPEDITTDLSIGDRPAMISLGSGFWLPRSGDDTVPITTVNTERLKVEIYRVGERALTRMDEQFLTEGSMSSYQVDDDLNKAGALVWSGEVPVSGAKNQDTVTHFALPEAMLKGAPGAYWLTASRLTADGQGEDSYMRRGQWLLRSDLGMTSYDGSNGLTVMVRSLATAKAQGKVALSLLAANNEVLGTTETDANGKAVFAAGLMKGTGGMQPVMVVAHLNEDFTLLDLRRTGFDLSDRGVQGRTPAANAVDAFLYSERGIYRPGESVYLTGLIRDASAEAAMTAGTWYVRIVRPNGQEYRTYPVTDPGQGAVSLKVDLPKSAALGVWEAALYSDPKGQPVGTMSFEVDTFVPQRLAVTVTPPQAPLMIGETTDLPVSARFLYGAVGSGLGGEGWLLLQPAAHPFPQYTGFQWGLENEDVERTELPLTFDPTDEQGNTVVPLTLTAEDVPKSSRPLQGRVRVDILEPGGRATRESASVTIASAPAFLALRPQFQGRSIPEGKDAGFDVLAVDGQGAPLVGAALRYRVVELRTTWQWFRQDSQWRYQPVVRERDAGAGTLTTAADGLGSLSQRLPWGLYRLEVQQQDGAAQASYLFTSGWYGQSSEDRPDRLVVSSDKNGYAPGETARLHIASEVAGEATVVIANEAVQEVHQLVVPAGGADLSIPVKEGWAAGAYALVSFYRPLGTELNHAPVRAVGVVWLGVDRAPRTLTVDIGSPQQVTPRQTVTVPLTLHGAKGKAFVTLAAVDRGILQLTHYQTPDPLGYYFQQRALGVEMLDDYGRIIRAQQAEGTDEGGDAGHGQGLETVPQKSVALFSGVVAVGADGRVEIPLEVPDFQGELRLMAVAYDAHRMGAAERAMTVRDPVVADVILPRFIGSDDQGRATVLLHNVAGQAGDYTVTVSTSGPVSGGQAKTVVTLAAGERKIYTVPLIGKPVDAASPATGIGRVALEVSGPGGFAVARDWPIQVRPPQVATLHQQRGVIQPGETLTLSAAPDFPLLPGSGSASLTVSRWLGLDVPGVLKSLDRYPYGCLEQTVSRAMPLLAFNDLAAVVLSQQDQTIAQRLERSVENVTSLQYAWDDEPNSAARFGLWSAGDEAGSEWLTAYAGDFLLQAAERGYDVPKRTIEMVLQSLSQMARSRYDGEADARAYASAILARMGRMDRQELAYFHDEVKPQSITALVSLGMAFDALSDQARASSSYDQALKAFRSLRPLSAKIAATRAELIDLRRNGGSEKAVAALTSKQEQQINTFKGYTGASSGAWQPSDVSLIYTLIGGLAHGNRLADIPDLLEQAQAMAPSIEDLTTREKAAMLFAARELAQNAGKVAVQINGQPVGKGDPISQAVSEADLAAGVKLSNQGNGPLFYALSQDGIPAQPLPAASDGISVQKEVFTPTGEPVDLADVHQNQRLVVVLTATAASDAEGSYGLLDLLPAGWEVEGMVSASSPGYAWLEGTTQPESTQASDDRVMVVAHLPRSSYDLSDDIPEYNSLSKAEQQRRSLQLRAAYVVRAVTPGTFALPAALAEYMPAVRVRGRSDMGQVVIAE